MWKILDKLDRFLLFFPNIPVLWKLRKWKNKKSADLCFAVIAVSWLLKLKIVQHVLISNPTQTINNGERKNPDHVHAKRDIIEIFLVYRTRAIITRGLYIFYPIFQCGLLSRAVNITDKLCTKLGNVGLQTPVYN